MSEPNYINATNKAYETLIKFNEFSHPVQIFNVIKRLPNVKLYKYSEYAMRNNLTDFEFFDLAPSEYGFTIYNSKKDIYQLIYNDLKDYTTIRFTLAHELGHIILKHKEDGIIEKKEANCFARNFLCPVLMAKELKLKTIVDYVNCFNVSEPMAEVSIKFQKCDFANIEFLNSLIYYNCMYQSLTEVPLGIYRYSG